MKKSIIMRTVVAAIVAVATLTAQHAAAFPMSHYTQSSKLSKGNWVKIKVTESGIYQITDADAKSWGFSGVAALHVFGKGGAPISETLTTAIPDDLPQVPVVRSNGKLVFYAQGPTTWKAGSNGLTFVQELNTYATAGYYFVTDSGEYTDIEATKSGAEATAEAVTTFTDRLFHENDIVNYGETGRVFLGEDILNNSTQTFNFNLKDRVEGSQVNVLTTAGVYQTTASGTGRFSFQSNGTNLPYSTADQFKYDGTKYLAFTPRTMPKSFTMTGTQLNFTVSLTLSGATLKMARLNAITVNYERQLAMAGNELAFATPVSWNGGTPMTIAKATTDMRVWDVTEPHQPVDMVLTTNGTSATFTTAKGGMREYIAFNPAASYSSPTMVEQVSNQDIHSQAVPDMIIITHPNYRTQAERVAQLHVEEDSMKVLVLNQGEIFNEFSSGTPDMMAYRMVCKYFYDRGTENGHHLQYVLLMGNGTFDNRQITSEFKGIAFPALLTWQSEASYVQTSSYCTDDAIAVLQDGTTGEWSNHKLDIAVGRFPVRSESEARAAVDKLINYVKTPNHGAWQNKMIVVADDEEKGTFMDQSEDYISSARNNGGKDLLIKRIYLDAYEAVSVGSTRNYPGARDDLYGNLKDGTLVWAFNGHSSTNVMTGNDLVRRNDFLNNMYYRNLPFVFGTTCEFARFDALSPSGGELMFNNSNGGAIGILSANREAWINDNSVLGTSMFKYMFSRDNDGMPIRIGDAWRLGNNNVRRKNNTVYTLLADPAMRLAKPRYTAQITAINGKAIDPENLPVFKARQSVTFTGNIVDHKGNKVNNFNGSVTSNLFDCDQSVTTHGYGTDGKEFTYQEHSNRIALGNDSVKNGDFSIKLTIPSEIMFSYDNYTPSLINLYAYDQKNNIDAMGSSEDFYIYGYDETIKTDTIGPDIIYLGLNSENFKNGDDVNESPLVIASMTTPYGINLSDAGIGHSMSLTLDDEEVYNDINGYYTPIHTESGAKGSISYPLKDLTNGYHTLRLRVWDVYSNMSEKTIAFNVVNGLKPEIYEVYATASPASTETTFYVKHNRPDATLKIKLDVYDLMGRLVWTTTQSGQSNMFTSFPITWNLTDLSGSRVHRGIYLYRATISTDGVREATKSKKLAVTGQ